MNNIPSSDFFAEEIIKLKKGESHLVVWGLGYIGLTTTLSFLLKGIKVIGIDNNQEKLEQIINDEICLNTELNFNISLKSFIKSNQLILKRNYEDILHFNTKFHFVCVPTEKNGKANSTNLLAVLNYINIYHDDSLVIIESTLSPKWLSYKILKEMNIGIAPRRDWFHSNTHTIDKLDRICSSNNIDLLCIIKDLITIVSPNVVVSRDILATAMTKPFENSLWFMLFSYVCELATHISDVDFSEVLRLTSTNWRTTFDLNPGFQVGGYCLPLSVEYIQDMINNYELVTIKAAKKANDRMIDAVFGQIQSVDEIDSVLILGVTYREGIKIHTNSSGMRLIEKMNGKSYKLYGHDPLYTKEEFRNIFNAKFVTFPNNLDIANAIILCTNHECYRLTNMLEILKESKNIKLIIDCYGSLKKYKDIFQQKSIKYIQYTSRDWRYVCPNDN